jgi:hypothetical protein
MQCNSPSVTGVDMLFLPSSISGVNDSSNSDSNKSTDADDASDSDA